LHVELVGEVGDQVEHLGFGRAVDALLDQLGRVAGARGGGAARCLTQRLVVATGEAGQIVATLRGIEPN
jgi:hypothetical protein